MHYGYLRQKEKDMVKFTRHSLQKMEALFAELGYVIRYEKGSFNSGYCIVEDRKIVVINKFYDVEGRMAVLVDILLGLEFEPAILSEKSARFFSQIQKSEEEQEEVEE